MTSSKDEGQMEPRFGVVDLFSGSGGLSQGFRQAGYEVLAGSDHDPDALATFAANFPRAASLCGDIRDPLLRERLNEVASTADVIVGGPPCQAFSQVRNHSRLIDDPRNSLYREFVSTVGAALPNAFLMENVPGMAQMGVKEQVRNDLSLDGEYEVAAQLVDAADFGVPQTRKRLLFMGVKKSLGVAPPRLVGSGATSSVQLVRFANAGADGAANGYAITARPDAAGERIGVALADRASLLVTSAEQAIGDLRQLVMGRREEALSPSMLPAATSAYQTLMRGDEHADLTNVSVPRSRVDTTMRLAGIPAGGNQRDLSEMLRARYLTDTKWGPHNGTGQLGRAHFSAYRRLHPDIWAWTLNTKGDSVYHYEDARCLSVREFARLQSFPDSFVFKTDSRRGPIAGRVSGGGAHSRYRQVGNAVPPLLAQSAALALRASLMAAREPAE